MCWLDGTARAEVFTEDEAAITLADDKGTVERPRRASGRDGEFEELGAVTELTSSTVDGLYGMVSTLKPKALSSRDMEVFEEGTVPPPPILPKVKPAHQRRASGRDDEYDFD